MNKNTNLVYVLIIAAAIILSSVLTYVMVYDPCEPVVIKEQEPQEKMHQYKVSWTENKVVISEEEIKENFSRSLFYSDGKKLNGLIDGTYRFRLDFRVPEKFLKEVTISASWKDRFPLLGLMGKDIMYMDIITPDGSYETRLIEFPIMDFLSRLKNNEASFANSNITFDLNACPPDANITANNTEDAVIKYWDGCDTVLDYNRGYSGKWEVKGVSEMGEIRVIRRVRNIFRNTIANLFIEDALKLGVTYSYCTMELEDLGEI